MKRVVIVGGVAGGMSAATRLRRLDEEASITVIERGDYVSFANCGLPYHLGGVIENRDALLLQTPASLRARFGIDVRVRHEAIAIDREAHTVRVRDLTRNSEADLDYDYLVLATGARALRPPIDGIERALALRDVADMDAIIARMVPDDGPPAATAAVLGAGFVGLEVAENLHRRGLHVTVIEAADQVLTPLDPEMAAPVAAHLRDQGIDVRLGAGAERIGTGDVELAGGEKVNADLVIVAVGVAPESRLAAQAGLELGPRESIAVGPNLRTSDPAIFAVGDVAAKRAAIDGSQVVVPLAQSANRHGRLVADAISGRPVSAESVLGTAIVGLFGQQIAVTGWNERRARASGRDVRVIHTHPVNHAGYYPGAQGMSLKLVVDAASDEILGAQGVGGEGVDKRIDVIATAIRGGLRASQLADLELAYAPQFGSAKDPVVLLGMIAENLANGLDKTTQWHELRAAQEAGATLIDVRTTPEYEAGTIPGSLSVPLDELRERASELPDGDVIVCCAVGQRGHVAARLLNQLGRDVTNLDGGYRTWRAAELAQTLATE